MVKSMAAENGQTEKYKEIDENVLLKSVEKCVGFYEKQIATPDKQIDKVISKHREIKAHYDAITSVKDVGKKTTYLLIAEMPELGNIGKREVAALVEVHTMNYDSERGIVEKTH
jgi:transposase